MLNNTSLPSTDNKTGVKADTKQLPKKENKKKETIKLTPKKKAIIAVLSFLLVIDIAVLVMYIIGFEKIFTFIK